MSDAPLPPPPSEAEPPSQPSAKSAAGGPPPPLAGWALLPLPPPPKFGDASGGRLSATSVLIAVTILVNVGVLLSWTAAPRPIGYVLAEWGGNFGPVTRESQPWRLFTSLFPHVDPLHLLMNVVAIWQLGRLAERMFGASGMLSLYFATGMWGSLASAVTHDFGTSAGASGAVFGLYGAVCGAALLRWKDFAPQFRAWLILTWWQLPIGMAVVAAAYPNVDHAAHAGGAASGFLLGLLLPSPVAPPAPRTRAFRSAALGCAAAAAVLLVWAHLPSYPSLYNEVRRFHEAYAKLYYDLQPEDGKPLSAETAIQRLVDDHEPRWKKLREEWSQFRGATASGRGDASRTLRNAADAVLDAIDLTLSHVYDPTPTKLEKRDAAWHRLPYIEKDVDALLSSS